MLFWLENATEQGRQTSAPSQPNGGPHWLGAGEGFLFGVICMRKAVASGANRSDEGLPTRLDCVPEPGRAAYQAISAGREKLSTGPTSCTILLSCYHVYIRNTRFHEYLYLLSRLRLTYPQPFCAVLASLSTFFAALSTSGQCGGRLKTYVLRPERRKAVDASSNPAHQSLFLLKQVR